MTVTYAQDTITTAKISSQTEGYIISYEDLARLVPAEAGNQYRTAHGRRLTGEYNDKVCGGQLAALRKFAQPKVLGNVSGISAGPDIVGGSLVIKQSGSLEIAIPEIYAQFLPIANFVGRDLLFQYGAEGFKNVAIQLVAQRTDIQPGHIHRAHISGWHDHLSTKSNPEEIDVVYGFSDNLGTKFRQDFKERSVPPASLVRFGAEHVHCSPTNNTDEVLRRTWGAFVVSRYGAKGYANNHILEQTADDRRLAFQLAALEHLDHAENNFVAHEQPQPLF